MRLEGLCFPPRFVSGLFPKSWSRALYGKEMGVSFRAPRTAGTGGANLKKQEATETEPPHLLYKPSQLLSLTPSNTVKPPLRSRADMHSGVAPGHRRDRASPGRIKETMETAQGRHQSPRSEECATVPLGVMSSSPTLGVEIM